jgi:hypothetical protein
MASEGQSLEAGAHDSRRIARDPAKTGKVSIDGSYFDARLTQRDRDTTRSSTEDCDGLPTAEGSKPERYVFCLTTQKVRIVPVIHRSEEFARMDRSHGSARPGMSIDSCSRSHSRSRSRYQYAIAYGADLAPVPSMKESTEAMTDPSRSMIDWSSLFAICVTTSSIRSDGIPRIPQRRSNHECMMIA